MAVESVEVLLEELRVAAATAEVVVTVGVAVEIAPLEPDTVGR